MSLIDRLLGRRSNVERVERRSVESVSPDIVDYDSSRPVGSYVPYGTYLAGAIPFYAIPFSFYYDLAYNNDYIRTVVRAIIQETFRKGIRIKRRYAFKCARCHVELNQYPEGGVCPVCGGDEFVVPNDANKHFLETVLNDANRNDESLLEVLMAVDWDLNVVDNAFLVVLKRYYYDDEGNIIGAEPVEVLRGDPKGFRLVIDKQGRPGRDEQGRIVMFCPEHRDNAVAVEQEEFEAKGGRVKCPLCGREMLVAHYRHDSAGGKRIYYGDGEVLHVKKFTYGLGYGYPPLASVWMKAMILMRQDYFILMGYQLMRSPRGMLIFKGVSPEEVSKAWARLMEYARNNPWMIYPITLPSTEQVDVQYLDLSFELRDIDFGEYREELRHSIASLYGVMPIFMGETAGAGRDVMQVMVTNRAIQFEQRLFNEKILPWLSRQLGVDDWVFELVPSELRDERTFTEIQLSKLELVERLVSLGYDVEVDVRENGEIEYRVVGKKQQDMSLDATGLDARHKRTSSKRRASRKRKTAIEGLTGAPEAGDERPRLESSQQRIEGEPGLPPESRLSEVSD
ncbi:MAG: hypothetical protein QW320_06700 [Ignisphaera sp.]